MPRKSLMAAATAALQEAAAPAYEVHRPSEVLHPDIEGAVSVDTETSGLFADDGARTSVVSVAFLDPDGLMHDYAFPFDQGMRDKAPTYQPSLMEAADPNLPRSEWEYLLEWLDDDRRQLTFHNAPFDLEKIRVGTRHWPGRELEHRYHWDTRLACSEIWPTEATSLKPTAVRLWGEGEDDAQGEVKAWLKRNKLTMGDADKVPWDIIGPYAAKDAEQTLRLYLHQIDLIECGEASAELPWIRRQIELSRVAYRMTRRGLGYDSPGSLDAAELVDERADEILARLPFEPTPAKAKAYFKEHGGEPYFGTTDTGGESMNDEALYKMAQAGVPHADDWGRYSKLKRANSMWYRGYPGMIGGDGRLRTSFRQAHVKSGRFSVERVQLQAIPKGDKDFEGIPGVRSFVRAKDGHQLWNLDLSQAELRVASRYANCTKMLEMLSEGQDLHGVTAQEVLHVHPSAPDWKAQRDIAKRLTFGGIFQVGPKTFRETLMKLAHLDLPLDQCTIIVKGWRDAYPEFGRAYRQAERQAYDKGFVKVLPGTDYEKRSWFGPRDWPNTAWNRVVQGSLAHAVALWIMETERLCAEFGVPEALVLTVHDSVVLELPADQPELVVGLINAITEWVATRLTELFGIEMKADVGMWHKSGRIGDQYAGLHNQEG